MWASLGTWTSRPAGRRPFHSFVQVPVFRVWCQGQDSNLRSPLGQRFYRPSVLATHPPWRLLAGRRWKSVVGGWMDSTPPLSDTLTPEPYLPLLSPKLSGAQGGIRTLNLPI